MNKYQNNSPQGKNTKRDKVIRTNWNIKSHSCRVIEDGMPPKVMSRNAAIEYAQSKDLDLIEIGFDKAGNCSNCKIADYSKYIYELKKREKEAKKQARAAKTVVKSVQMSLTTDTADKARMVAHAKEFLAEGDKVKLSLRFRNRRESANMEYAKNVMKEVLKEFEGLAALDSGPTLAGRELSCILRKI